MPDFLYYSLGGDKKLNEIVMAGSHDAGITSGGKNTMTQHRNLGQQAEAGVRVFDLRVAAATVSGKRYHDLKDDVLHIKDAELKAVHEPQGAFAPLFVKREEKSRWMGGKKETIDRTKLSGGGFGEGLSAMLNQAAVFVENNKSEFLILKFDKSTNWQHIADLCYSRLSYSRGNRYSKDGYLYREAGNLNTKTLDELKGKVIVLFTKGGLDEIDNDYRGDGGIHGVKNLHAGGAYDDDYDGLQYFGKGGTDPLSPFGKIKQNIKKQSKLMSKGAECDPNVMGMMYWTTTGLSESIRERNRLMWRSENREKFKMLWTQGLQGGLNAMKHKAVQNAISRLVTNVDPTSYSSGPVLKSFMPNIVMIDFATPKRCKQIFELNDVAATELTTVATQIKENEEMLESLLA